MFDPTRRMSMYNDPRNMVTIKDNGWIVIGKNESYNVFTDRTKLIERIASMSNSTESEMLNAPMNSSQDVVMSVVRQHIQNGAQQVKLPNGFVIDREDIVHDNGNHTYGSTWLGYLLRNEYIGTRGKGAEYRQVNIDNLKLVLKSQQNPQEQKVQEVDDRQNARRTAM